MSSKTEEETSSAGEQLVRNMLCDYTEEELNLIKSIEDVDSYKQKYSEYFIFDNNEIEISANPHLKIGKFGYSYVCNINGDVVINGEICNYNNLISYEETSDYKTINSPSTRNNCINSIYHASGGRRFWAQVKLVGEKVYIEFYARKKVMWTWHDYKTTYGAEYKSHTQEIILPDETPRPQIWLYADQKNPSSFGLLWLIGRRGDKDATPYPWSSYEVEGRYTMFFDERVPLKNLDPNKPDQSVYRKTEAKIKVSCRSGINSDLYVYPNLL